MAYSGATTRYAEPATGVKMATPLIGADSYGNAVVNYDAAGAALFTAANEGYTRVRQNAVRDANNSSSANLEAGTAFTGTAVDTTGVVLIQVSLYANKNCTVQVQQSANGVNWYQYSQFSYVAGDTHGYWQVNAVIGYWRVVVTNTDSAASTTFVLESYLCPIGNAGPAAPDEDGNMPVGIKSIEDGYGFEAECTPTDELRVVQPYRLVGSVFSGATLDTNFWTATNGTGGSTTVGNAQAVLASGANNTAVLNSARTARYVGAAANRFRAVIRVPTVTGAGGANTVVRFGAFSATDGAYFELAIDGAGAPTFKVVTRKGSSDTAVTSFNGVLGAAYALTTGVKTFEIYWSNSKVWFVIGGDLLHTMSATSTTWADTMHHPVRAECISTGSNSAQLNIRVATISRLGAALTQPAGAFQSGTTAGRVLKYGPGTLRSMTFAHPITSGSVVTLYDNTSATGTILFQTTLTFGNQSGSFPITLQFNDMPFFTGLTLVIATQTANVLVVYE